VGDQVRIGYSFWGFLGAGITDTPDGGRSHRRILVDGLIAAKNKIIFLQADRDLTEANTDLRHCYTWDEAGLPDVDLLFLEWRWPIPGRNTIPCGHPNHTCDLHRQHQLIEHYTQRVLPTIIWDKDQQLPKRDPLREHPAVIVCEPALHPTPGAHSVLFPVADDVLDHLDPARAVEGARPWPLVYIGNQYDRDPAFDTYFAPAAASHAHQVAGKWTDTTRWPYVNFIGRVPFRAVEQLYHDAISTVLLLPDRYARSGQMTQRLFEAVLAGCLPLAPTAIRDVERYVPAELHVHDGHDVSRHVEQLGTASIATRAELLASCVECLELFRLSRQVGVLDTLMTKPPRSSIRLAL
jgi:hypothetical protein